MIYDTHTPYKLTTPLFFLISQFNTSQVTVSTVNMLTTVLNDSPIFPENEEEQADLSAPLLMDSPQVHDT